MPVLETERRYLDAHRDELLREYGGKFLIISGEQVAGAYNTMEEALEAAVTKYGLKNVLIRQAAEAQIEFSAPALTLGLLNADSTHTVGSTGKDPKR